MFGTAWVCQIERRCLIQVDFRGLLFIYSILLAFINDGLIQVLSRSSSAHRARPADKGGVVWGKCCCKLSFPFFFLGRLGLGNEDDCAAPQKVT